MSRNPVTLFSDVSGNANIFLSEQSPNRSSVPSGLCIDRVYVRIILWII